MDREVVEPPRHERAPELVLVREVEQVDVLAHQVARTWLVTLGEHQLDTLGARAVQAELGGHVEAGELDLVIEVRGYLERKKLGEVGALAREPAVDELHGLAPLCAVLLRHGVEVLAPLHLLARRVALAGALEEALRRM